LGGGFQNGWVEHTPPSGNILQLWKLSGGNCDKWRGAERCGHPENTFSLDRHAPPALAKTTEGLAVAGFLPTRFGK